jgi:hypothetical protein
MIAAVVQPSPNTSGPFVTAITLILVFIAVRRSQQLWRTLLYLVGVMLLAGLIAGAIGWLRSLEAAGSFSALAVQLAGIAASIERIIRAKQVAKGGGLPWAKKN